jgi:fucose permease
MSGEDGILEGYAGRMLVVGSIGWAMIQICRRTLPALLPIMSEELTITPTAVGFLLTVLSTTYAVMQYPSGRFSDRFSRKGPLVVGVMLSVLGCFLLWSAHGYEVLLGGVLVIGWAREST